MSTEAKALHNEWAMKIAARLRHGELGFNAIERSIEAPNPPMLSAILKKMIRDGLLIRTVLELGPPARTSYTLTPIGHQFAAASAPLQNFIRENLDAVRAARDYARSIGHSVRAPRQRTTND